MMLSSLLQRLMKANNTVFYVLLYTRVCLEKGEIIKGTGQRDTFSHVFANPPFKPVLFKFDLEVKNKN